MTYYHTYTTEVLELRPEEERVLAALVQLPEIQKTVQVMLVEQNRPDWAFSFLAGCHRGAQAVDPAHSHARALTLAYEYLVARGITERTARPEYERYVGIKVVV